jgi:hypothetical protein
MNPRDLGSQDSSTELASGLGFVWDPTVARYRDLSNGQFVSESDLQDLVDNYADDYLGPQIEQLTDQMIGGDISLSDWQVSMAESLKQAYVTVAAIGRGGRSAMDYSDFGRIGARLRSEYKYLDGFAQEIKSGTLSPSYIRARAQLYADGVKVALWDGRRAAKIEAGMTLEKRVLHPAEHCTDCMNYADQGWQPIGTFPPPGLGSECLHHCRCTMDFSKE